MSVKIVKSQEIMNSSQVKAVAYTADNDVLVTFTRGSEYLYKNVPEELYEEMIKAESVGKFLNANIKGKFEYLPLLPEGSK